jgi:hypothetical protein
MAFTIEDLFAKVGVSLDALLVELAKIKEKYPDAASALGQVEATLVSFLSREKLLILRTEIGKELFELVQTGQNVPVHDDSDFANG